MKYKTIFIWFFLITVLIGQKPNIIFFISDDLSKTDASVYGKLEIKTPNMDLLAREGLKFNNAFIASPACAPSRAALLTGLMPSRNGAEANHTYPKPNIPFLIENMKAAGYEVIAFGKVAHGKGIEDCSFDYYEDVKKRGSLTSALESYLSTRESTKPICAFFGDYRPHVLWIKESSYNSDEAILPEYFIDTKETREHWARYCTDITGLDEELGKIFNFIKEKFVKDYVFLFSSDHGSQWPFGKWNLYDAGINVPLIISWPKVIKNGSVSEALVSWVDIIPTLIEIAGGVNSDTLDGFSFLPVLKGEKLKHRSEIYTTHSGDGDKNVYPIRSIRTDKYKYILNLYPEYQHTNHSDLLRKDGAGAYWDSWELAAENDKWAAEIIKKYHIRPKEEFYDIETDPLEKINLISSAAHNNYIEDLRKKLTEWMADQRDSKRIFNEPYKAVDP